MPNPPSQPRTTTGLASFARAPPSYQLAPEGAAFRRAPEGQCYRALSGRAGVGTGLPGDSIGRFLVPIGLLVVPLGRFII